MLQDVRFAVRTLFKNPGFTAVAVLALGLGIGANTAIFTLIRTVLLKPLPYPESRRIMALSETFLPAGYGTVSTPNFIDWRAQNRSFEELAAYHPENRNLQGIDNPERIPAVTATSNLFKTLGVQPALGRTFAPGEDQPSAQNVVVLAQSLWTRRFASNPGIIGQTITLDGEAHTVIGVMPSSFRFPPSAAIPTELWVSLKFTPDNLEKRGSHWMWVVGRLKPGVSVEVAREDMNAIAAQLAKQYPKEQTGRRVLLRPLHETVAQGVRPALLVLMSAVGLVLLIACANVANLLLARAAVREREVAIRSALGASRKRLVRQFLTESLLLSVAGGLLGGLLAKWGVDALLILSDGSIPRQAEVGFDGLVFVFLLGTCVLTGVLFGIVPALQSSRTDLNERLKEGGAKGAVGSVRGWFRSSLVVAEITLSCVLLIAAGLLMKAFLRLQSTPSGLKPQSVLTFRVAPPQKKFSTVPLYEGFYKSALERIREIPGVRAAGAIQLLPIQSWGWNGEFSIEGRPPDAPGREPFAEYRFITPGYFQAMGVPIARGRDITDADNSPKGNQVVLVNESLAKLYFPGQEAIGKRIGDPPDFAAIVGVVGDVKQTGLDQPVHAEMYIPLAEVPDFGKAWTEMAVVVGADMEPTALTSAVRAAVRAVAPDQPIFGVKTMERVISDSLSSQRLYLVLIALFAGIAVTLACAGVYGVLSYLVAQRTREFGVRMALGAGSRDVVRSVLAESVVLGGIGVAVGIAGAFAVSRALQQFLYEVKPRDPLVYGIVAAIILAVVVMASLVPARRAMKVDPMVALRWE